MIDPDAPKKKEDFEKSITIHRGGYVGIVKDRAKELFFGQTLGFFLGGFWLAGGRMLIGMGLMKLDVFSGRRSRRFYISSWHSWDTASACRWWLTTRTS